VCRKREAPSKLCRLKLVNGELFINVGGAVKGRGAYVHPSLECVKKLVDVKRWERAFRLCSGTLTPACASSYCQRVENFLTRDSNR
jgi:predicted RNA-binding protein YlxR (DUF448 family)